MLRSLGDRYLYAASQHFKFFNVSIDFALLIELVIIIRPKIFEYCAILEDMIYSNQHRVSNSYIRFLCPSVTSQSLELCIKVRVSYSCCRMGADDKGFF